MPICSSIQWLWVLIDIWVVVPASMRMAHLVSALPLLALLVVFVVLLAVMV